MPAKLAQVATITTTEELKLSPALRKKLQVKLQDYAATVAAMKQLEMEKGLLTAEIEAEREKLGLTSFDFQGFKVTLVDGGTVSYVDWDLIISEGWMSSEQKDASIKHKPKKGHTKITCPKGE